MTRAMLSILLILAATTATAIAAVTRESEEVTVVVPVGDDGRFDVNDLIRGLARELGVDASYAQVPWTPTVEPPAIVADGFVLAHALQSTGPTVAINAERVRVTVRPQVPHHDWIGNIVSRLRATTSGPTGVTFMDSKERERSLEALVSSDAAEAPERLVLLIHGLDDPGWMWDEIAPALRDAGHTVARFDYPNDGPIRISADRLTLALAQLHAAGIQHVDLVAHSMGGLVSRDALTRPGVEQIRDAWPSVGRLIMVGTPNHGSEWARLRGVSEVREHVWKVLTGEGGPAGGLADGSGEAGEDLLPGSEFLEDLNARPHPTSTAYTIIAARASPIEAAQVGDVLDDLRSLAEDIEAPGWVQDLLGEDSTDDLEGSLDSLVNGIGDGCVTLDSARLAGVEDFTIVSGNHVSMLANLISSDRIPPSIPIILDRLATDEASATSSEPPE